MQPTWIVEPRGERMACVIVKSTYDVDRRSGGRLSSAQLPLITEYMPTPGVVHLLVDLVIDAIIGVFLGGLQLLAKSASDRVFKKYALIGLGEAFLKEGVKEGIGQGLKDAGKAFKDWRVAQRVTALKLNALLMLTKGTASRTEIPKELGKTALDTFIGLSVGGPTGADMPYAPYGDRGGDWVNDTIDGWFYAPAK